MKKSQLRNIIRQVITEQLSYNSHSHIRALICGCEDIPGAPLPPNHTTTYCDYVMGHWVGVPMGFHGGGGNYTNQYGFNCHTAGQGAHQCTQQDIGKEFKMKLFHYNGWQHVANLYFTLDGIFSPLNTTPLTMEEEPCQNPSGITPHLDNDRDNPGYIPTVSHLDNDRDRDNPGYRPPVGHLDNDRDLPSGVDCRKFWSNPTQAQICCMRCEDLNLHPLTHPNHDCTQWCECCRSSI